MAYAFAFLNKLPNHDDVVYLFGKGATTDSGWWGIELLRLVIPDYSLPWLHGIVSLVFLAAAICMMLDLFRFQNVLTKLLLSIYQAYIAITAGLMILLPVRTGDGIIRIILQKEDVCG